MTEPTEYRADQVSVSNPSFLAYHHEEMELQRDPVPCLVCGVPTDVYGGVCSEYCEAVDDFARSACAEEDGKDYSDLYDDEDEES